MIRTKHIYHDACRASSELHILSEDERRKLQLHLCKMYKDLERLCDKHGLTVMMAFGSALGAVRHKGFIPWDDDIDVFMPRADYDKLITQLSHELPDNYILYAPNSTNGAMARFAKLIDKNTRFAEPDYLDSTFHTGVFIDIFPLDSITKGKCKNKLKKFLSMFLIYTSSSVNQYQTYSKFYRKLLCSTRDGRINYWFRRLYGFMFSFINNQRWFRIVDSFCRNDSDTGYLDFVQSDYRWIPIERDMFLPPIRGEFEGVEVYLPHRPIDYLEMEFGNWKWIPPKEERLEHYVVEFRI